MEIFSFLGDGNSGWSYVLECSVGVVVAVLGRLETIRSPGWNFDFGVGLDEISSLQGWLCGAAGGHDKLSYLIENSPRSSKEKVSGQEK